MDDNQIKWWQCVNPACPDCDLVIKSLTGEGNVLVCDRCDHMLAFVENAVPEQNECECGCPIGPNERECDSCGKYWDHVDSQIDEMELGEP